MTRKRDRSTIGHKPFNLTKKTVNQKKKGDASQMFPKRPLKHSPSMRVPVAIDMAASRAAGRRTLKNILIHSKNLTDRQEIARDRGRGG